MRVMKQAAEECRRERCIVSKGLVPLAERQIAGQDETAGFVPFGDCVNSRLRYFSLGDQHAFSHKLGRKPP